MRVEYVSPTVTYGASDRYDMTVETVGFLPEGCINSELRRTIGIEEPACHTWWDLI